MSDLSAGRSPWSRVCHYVGLGGLFLFAGFMGIGPSFTALGLAAMLLAILADPAAWPRLRGEPIVWLSAGFVLLLAVRTAFTASTFPETANEHWNAYFAWIRLWLFWVVAWWLAADTRRVFLVLSLALGGFLLYALWNLQLSDFYADARPGFGKTALAFALYSGTGLLGLGLLAPRMWGPRTRRGRFVLRVGLWAVLLAALAGGLLLTQSRLMWIALVIVAPPALWLRYAPAVRTATRRRHAPAVVALVVVLVAAVAIGNSAFLRDRFARESGTLASIARLDVDNIPDDFSSSLGTRFHLYHLGWEKWLEKPLLGWGPGMNRVLIGSSERENLRFRVDLHNGYLEVLVCAGLVGALFFFFGALRVVRGLFAARRREVIPRDLFLFVMSVLVLVAIWNLAAYRMVHTDFRYFWLLFGGIAFSWTLWRRAEPPAT